MSVEALNLLSEKLGDGWVVARQKDWYLKDIEGSSTETWRTGSSVMLWMYLIYPKDHILKVSWHYLYF